FMAYYNITIAIAQAILIVAIVIGAIISARVVSEKLKQTVKKTAQYLDFTQRESLEVFPFPIAVVEENGKIKWNNELFSARIIDDNFLQNDNIDQFIPGIQLNELSPLDSISTEYNGSKFTVFTSKIDFNNSELYCVYFVDDTVLKNKADEFELSRPTVLHIVFDNIEDISQNYKDSEVAVINGGLEKIIESWTSKFPCILRKIANGKFFIVAEERGLQSMIEERFKVLDEIRSFLYAEKAIGITLSIGAGRGNSMQECDDCARQSLEMAQSRGGDQVAIKTRGSYEFFGGVSGGIEKRTNTKTRIIASAIAELIESSENILVMGHCFSDLDSIGAAVGVCSAASAIGKPANIVLYREKTLADSLIKHLEENGMGELFIEPDEALKLVQKKTLLVVVDTHRADFLEDRKLYDAIDTVVVVDHHRKTVDYIDNAVIFYNEPAASSASEMITEILQYITAKNPLKQTPAEALLAGIMLDTRNFVLRTGVRSFEAAAYLRGRGADTVTVKQMFANSMDNYKLRNQIIGSSTTYKNCAISIAPDGIEDVRIVASQVADELLNITGIKSSYVLFRSNGNINISARSMGEMNVQIIMEKLGGGGHQTMAAAQLKGAVMEDALGKLRTSLDDFFETQN
ncbi:MAG: DHH family phosphoesterase, partial [Oscillospiraceae bacterium]